MRYLADEKGIKAVTVCFSDLEGRLHMLDYDKKFLLKSSDNLTFDGSSIRGFSQQAESDLRLAIDWAAFYWLPSDVFGPGKVLVFGEVLDRDGTPYSADIRTQLKLYTAALYQKEHMVCNAANEIEGFLFCGRNAEQQYYDTRAFEFITTSGYYHSLPGDALRTFIDTSAEVQRAMGFANEKDHPEVAPSQFEMNYSYTEANIAADQVLLYKLICRQVAQRLDMTASFLPKPMTGINGSGMHTNLSVARDGTNLFYDNGGKDCMSSFAWTFVDRILYSALDVCLILNSSVNSYRRLIRISKRPTRSNRRRLIAARWCVSRLATTNPRGLKSVRLRQMPIHIWPFIRCSRSGWKGRCPPTENRSSRMASCPTTFTMLSTCSRKAA